MPHVSARMRRDFFQRLPAPTALLLLSRLFELTRAHALPKQTSTVPYRVLDVVSWPLVPTPPPVLPEELRRRDLAADAICGYIGGDPGLPATCSPGSHCVLDAVHGAVGCCPNNDAVCTAGVFTGCVDSNSGPQTEVNPYVFTCGGGDVCYKNNFAGGFSQFGCGSASNLATTVPLSASGLTSNLVITSVSVSFTAPKTTLATPTTIPSTGTRSTTSSATSSRSSTSTTSSSSTTTAPPGPTDTAAPAGGGGNDKTGAIIGGAISGAAVLIALAALAFYLIRKRRRNARTGPGAGGTAYVRYGRLVNFPRWLGGHANPPRSPMSGHSFKPLHSTPPDGYEDPAHAPGMTTQITAGPQQTTATYHYPGQNPAAYVAAAGGAGAGAAMLGGTHGYHGGAQYQSLDTDQAPLTREFDDFSRGFQDALDRIGEEDEGHSGDLGERGSSSGSGGSGGSASHTNGYMANGNGNGYGLSAPGSQQQQQSQEVAELADGQAPAQPGDPPRPLWQQNRRQSRNLMWM